MEGGKDQGLETRLQYWEKVVVDQGHTGLLSIFPKEDFIIKDLRIKGRKGRKEYEARTIYSSGNITSPAGGEWGALYGIIEPDLMFEDPEGFSIEKPPEGTDIFSISDLKKTKIYARTLPNLPRIGEKMFGVVYSSQLKKGFRLPVVQIMLLPKPFFKEFVNDCLKAQIGKALVNRLFNGIDEVLPRVKTENLLIFVNDKLRFQSGPSVPDFKMP